MPVTLNNTEVKEILRLFSSVCYSSSVLHKKLERSLKRIKVSSAKAKGRRFQQKICKEISELINIPYVSGSDDSLIQSRPMGQRGCDIILLGKAKKVFPFSVECKNAETFNMRKTLGQAKSNDKNNWLILYKNTSIKPVVIMEWEVWKKLFRSKNL